MLNTPEAKAFVLVYEHGGLTIHAYHLLSRAAARPFQTARIGKESFVVTVSTVGKEIPRFAP